MNKAVSIKESKPILEVSGLTGGYSPRKPVLYGLSFCVHPGEIVGLIGLNGAGKSTTIKHILGLMEPLEGKILIHGLTRQDSREGYRSHFTYVPETPLLYEQLTLWEHLEFTAMSYGINHSTFKYRAEKLIHEFGMERMIRWMPGTFSKGMKQKVMIMCAFLVHPDLYIIDEPFVGLDPKGIRSLLNMILARRNEGAGFLMSTHILSTAQEHCDRFLLLHEGRLLHQGTLNELREQTSLPEASLEQIFMRVIGA